MDIAMIDQRATIRTRYEVSLYAASRVRRRFFPHRPIIYCVIADLLIGVAFGIFNHTSYGIQMYCSPFWIKRGIDPRSVMSTLTILTMCFVDLYIFRAVGRLHLARLRKLAPDDRDIVFVSDSAGASWTLPGQLSTWLAWSSVTCLLWVKESIAVVYGGSAMIVPWAALGVEAEPWLKDVFSRLTVEAQRRSDARILKLVGRH